MGRSCLFQPLVEEVESELKVLHIPEAVGAPFQHLDLVVEAFQGAGRDAVLEVVEQAAAVAVEGACQAFEELVTDALGLLDPVV